ncbi:hypothetical protein CCY99_08950 [Helicobacter sp. 16-1353]|uniref:phosphoribosyltransferase n=1 Tax=Helicobacter sp. 16-1353 TaxID=2004996 RepID=UPI000DCD2563|nr:ComF family protein [Helicobacter sp. 16-1353]RAX51490.1 hypothetical protein CCY99_08950 [Helicobacter sp. 16-1353]
MKCLLCEKINLKIICNACDNSIKITPKKRIDFDDFAIYSFFDYQSVEYLLKSKYSLIGSRIYKILARKAYLHFKNEVHSNFNDIDIYGIGIDDKVSKFYSHSGIIVKEFSKIFKPLFGALIANNDIHYAGKSLEYRQNNKKGFIYKGKNDITAVLLDDIITTGLSIKEAREKLLEHNVNVLFALTLSDARF